MVSDVRQMLSSGKSLMRFCFLVLVFQCFCFAVGAEEDFKKLQDRLNAIYEDAGQVYNEAKARGRLINEDLNESKVTLDSVAPEMGNLLFQMKGLLTPSLDIRRQVRLASRYQDEISQIINAIREQYSNNDEQVKGVCEQIDKWKQHGSNEDKRKEILEQSKQVLQTVGLSSRKKSRSC